MSDDILTIEEVAKYLRVSERTIYEWSQKGEIPAGKIGTVWRFKKKEIENWVDEKLGSSSVVKSSQIKINPENFLSPDRITTIEHSTKHDALLKLSHVLSTAPQIKNAAELEEGILKRENLMSTAIGRGIAIPHVRLSSVTDLVMAVGISKKGIKGFDAVDETPVHIMIMIAAALNQHEYYLQTISYFANLLKNKTLTEQIIKEENPEIVYSVLCNGI